MENFHHLNSLLSRYKNSQTRIWGFQHIFVILIDKLYTNKFLKNITTMYFLRPEKIGAKQEIIFTASQIWEMACAK